jgi:uncharacterized protein YgbK (DUF1537 family)
MKRYIKLKAKKIFSELPPDYSYDLMDEIRQENRKHNRTIVVLDDDPTGTQTAHGVAVLTEWTTSAFMQEFEQKTPIFYVLTNSRSLTATQANRLSAEIGENLKKASLATGRAFFVISRSDSTLRGHYPNEVDALLEVLDNKDAVRFLVPAFSEGGRYTIRNIHYVKEGDELVPASETPFARDKAFGFRHSDLKEYVEEKTKGAVTADQVIAFSIEDLRTQGPQFIRDKINELPGGSTCIVNAASYRDLQVFALGLLKSNKKVILRTAASIVPVLAGLDAKPLLSADDFKEEKAGGVFMIVGSYVPKTTAQLEELKKEENLHQLEADVQQILTKGDSLLKDLTAKINQLIGSGLDVLVYTSRKLVTVDDQSGSLQIGNKVSDFMTALVQGLTSRPKCILAKGGITSSDIATKGLNVKKAEVIGQVAAGIPVWKLGSESKFPGITYVVFPGNVGDDDTLRKVYQIVR